MKFTAFILIALSGLAAAEEPRPETAAEGPPRISRLRVLPTAPWLGLKVGRMDEAVRAQVPNLPPGFGFVVASVDPGGPAEKAGVKAYDILWKLDDQWITNEAQLFALLQLRKEGEDVKLAVYRSGKEMILPVILAKMPEEMVHGKAPSALPEGIRDDTPTKVKNLAEHTAMIDLPDGKAVLSMANGVPEVKISSSSGTVIYLGPVSDAQGVSMVPDPWKPRVGALERALAHAMKENPVVRSPRSRVLPLAESSGE